MTDPRRVPATKKLKLARTPEAAVLRACLHYLSVQGIMAWRNNKGAGKFRNAKGSERFMRFGGPNGASDLIGYMPDGRALFVETKASDGEPTPDQLEFLARARKAGCVAILARSLDDLIAGLEAAKQTNPPQAVEALFEAVTGRKPSWRKAAR